MEEIKKTKLKKIRKIINLENILCVFLIICPILDIASFVFRNAFNVSFSPSTFIRPIIPIIVGIFIFFTSTKTCHDKITCKI